MLPLPPKPRRAAYGENEAISTPLLLSPPPPLPSTSMSITPVVCFCPLPPLLPPPAAPPRLLPPPLPLLRLLLAQGNSRRFLLIQPSADPLPALAFTPPSPPPPPPRLGVVCDAARFLRSTAAAATAAAFARRRREGDDEEDERRDMADVRRVGEDERRIDGEDDNVIGRKKRREKKGWVGWGRAQKSARCAAPVRVLLVVAKPAGLDFLFGGLTFVVVQLSSLKRFVSGYARGGLGGRGEVQSSCVVLCAGQTENKCCDTPYLAMKLHYRGIGPKSTPLCDGLISASIKISRRGVRMTRH